MPKKRRLSAAHKQKIARGVRRYYRAQRDKARRRSLAAKRAAVTRKANRTLRAIEKKKAVPLTQGPAADPRAVEEWEVTVKYPVGRGKHHGEVVDMTLRMIGKAGLRFTNTQVRAAAWYAMQHGATSLSEFSLEAVDWYNTRRGGATQEYHYEHGGRDTALENARGIFKTVGIGGLRVAPVE